MLLKKFSYLLLSALLVTSVACKDDDGGPVIDITDPAVNLTSPTQEQLNAGFDAGSSFNVVGTVTDQGGLQSVSLTVAAPGGGATWYTRNWSATQINGTTLTLNETIEIPADAPAGTHVMTLRASDLAGNDEEMTWDINVRAAQQGNANITLTVPAGTPENAEIFLVGTMTPSGWDSNDSDEAWMLTRNTDGTYSGNFMFPEGTAASEFKFRIKSDDTANLWKFVEKTADCQETSNRVVTGTAEVQNLTYTVDNWRNIDPCGDE